MSELARQYENEVDSGINIEMAKQILREEDQFDKQRFREKIKERHREEKRKLKAAKKAETNDADEDAGDDHGSESEADESPDLSWLPDPDKIYGKQQDENRETLSTHEEGEEDESEEDEDSEEESIVHR